MNQIINQLIKGSETRGARLSIRLHLIIGLVVVVILAGGLGGWASTAQISGALFTPCRNITQLVGSLASRNGSPPRICAMPDGPQTIAYVA